MFVLFYPNPDFIFRGLVICPRILGRPKKGPGGRFLIFFFYEYLLRVQKSNFFPMGDFLTPTNIHKKSANRISVSENVRWDVS